MTASSVSSPEELAMSISPVQDVNANPVTVERPNERVRWSSPTPAPPEQKAVELHLGPGAGDSRTPQSTATLRVDSGAEEVEVQRDPLGSGQIVVRYLDKATGDLILQVPSNQVLSVARGINQEFQREAKDAQATIAASASTLKGQKHDY